MRDVLLKDLSRDDWLEVRKRGLGGSDMCAIMEQSPWTTPLDVYLDKIGESEPIKDNPRMKAGRFLESAVADMFADEYSDISVRADTKMRVHPDIPYIFANTDRLLQDEDGNLGVLEIKTTSGFYAKTWESSVPYQYYVQLQHYLWVMDYQYGYIAILIDGWDYRSFRYERDDNLIAEMEQRASWFWNGNVLKLVPPEATNNDDLKKLFPEEEAGSKLEADVIDTMDCENYLEAQAQEAHWKSVKDASGFKIKKTMEDKEFLVDNGEILATLKKNKKGNRVLSVKKKEN